MRCVCSECQRSQSRCKLSQSSGPVPRASPKDRAESALTPRRPLTISFSRAYVHPRCSANALWLIPRGFKNSSRSISPGWVGGLFLGSIRYLVVIVDDSYFGSVTVFPKKDDSPLIVDPQAPERLPVASEFLEVIARWASKHVERRSCVDEVQQSSGLCMKVSRELSRVSTVDAVIDILGQSIRDRLYHHPILSKIDIRDKTPKACPRISSAATGGPQGKSRWTILPPTTVKRTEPSSSFSGSAAPRNRGSTSSTVRSAQRPGASRPVSSSRKPVWAGQTL